MDNENKNELTEKLLEDENLDIAEVAINKKELEKMYYSNMRELAKSIKSLTNKEEIQRLLIVNINLRNIAKKDGIDLFGYHFLVDIAEKIGYNVDRVRSVLSVGAYYRPQRPEDQSRLTNKR